MLQRGKSKQRGTCNGDAESTGTWSVNVAVTKKIEKKIQPSPSPPFDPGLLFFEGAILKMIETETVNRLSPSDGQSSSCSYCLLLSVLEELSLLPSSPKLNVTFPLEAQLHPPFDPRCTL